MSVVSGYPKFVKLVKCKIRMGNIGKFIHVMGILFHNEIQNREIKNIQIHKRFIRCRWSSPLSVTRRNFV